MSNTFINSNSNSFLNSGGSLKSGDFIKENFFLIAMLVVIVLIVVICVSYFFYMFNLNSRECGLMNSLYSDKSTYIHSLNFADENCNYSLRDYYINTAYNCCSGGSYKNDYVNTCILKDIIKQGVRGLDFEIYSINDQPVIATSTSDNYHIKETYNYVMFSDAMNIIVNNGFSSSTAPNANDPIILHFRIKSTNQKMYSNLAAIFRQYADKYLLGPKYSYEYSTCTNETECLSQNLGDVKLKDLSGKIIIIVDKLNTAFIDNAEFYEFVNMTSNSMFMRALTYDEVKFTPDMGELQEYNKKNMTIVLPNNDSNPDNPSGIISREMGCQMTAMRFEQFDSNLQENIEFFDKANYAFVLKPEKLRYVPITIEATPPNDPLLSFDTRTVSSDYYSFNT